MPFQSPIEEILSANYAVSEILHKFKYVNYDMNLERVSAQMNWSEHSSVAVVDDNNHLFGIITEQDITSMLKNNINPKTIRAWELCSHKIKSVQSSDSIMEAINKMATNNIHHLAVIDNGALKGLISALDILKFIHKKKS